MTPPGDRTSWDAVACAYARLLPDMSAEAPLDRALLGAFAETVPAGGLVAEVGCGAGRVTAHLAGLGLRVVGLDHAVEMVREAHRAHPGLGFAVGDVAALPVRAAALDGLVAWYSLITLPPERLPVVLAECARVLRPGAPVVVAFQSGDGEQVERATSYGLPVSLTYHRHRVDVVVRALEGAGLALEATVVREPAQGHESTPQALLLARRR